MLAGDVPALVSLDYAVAQGMPFPVPPLPPYLAHIYTRPPPSLPQGSGARLGCAQHSRASSGAATGAVSSAPFVATGAAGGAERVLGGCGGVFDFWVYVCFSKLCIRQPKVGTGTATFT
jgi:hypothetical protein